MTLVSRRLLLESALQVVAWIERCNAPNTDQQGDWLEEDALSPTFREVLGAMGRDAAPVLLEEIRAFEAWADERPDDLAEMPRVVGTAESALRGQKLERMVRPYSLWMLQRSRDAYRALDEAARERVDEAMAGTGWEAVLAYQPRHRLAKRDFALVFE